MRKKTPDEPRPGKKGANECKKERSQGYERKGLSISACLAFSYWNS